MQTCDRAQVMGNFDILCHTQDDYQQINLIAIVKLKLEVGRKAV